MAHGKIALFYGHVSGNFGDLANNRGAVNLLQECFPDASIHCVFLNGETSKFIADARASFASAAPVSFSHFKSSENEITGYLARPDKFLADCGAADADLIALNTMEHYGPRQGHNSAGLFWRMLPAFAARAGSRHCILLPSTLGPFRDAEARLLASTLMSLVDDGAARETLSAEFLATLSTPFAPITLLDPAFFVDMRAAIAKAAGTAARARRTLGLVMRSGGWGSGIEPEQAVAPVRSFQSRKHENSRAFQFSATLCREFLAQRGTEVHIIVQSPADEELATCVRSSLAEESDSAERIEVSRPASLDEYLAQIAAVDCVASSRLHALILALVTEKPVVAAYFDEHGHEIPGLCELLGLSESCISLSAIEPGEAARSAGEMLLRAPRTPDGVRARIGDLRDRTRAWLKGSTRKPDDDKRLSEAFRAFSGLSSVLLRKSRDRTHVLQERALTTQRTRLTNLHAARVLRLEERHQLADAVLAAQLSLHQAGPWRLLLGGVAALRSRRRRSLPHFALYCHYLLRRPRIAADLVAVAASGFFDPAFYLESNPDVAASGADPLLHYVDYGARELRNPSPYFDTEYYLRSNPDVARHGANALIHFVKHGLREGRQPAPIRLLSGYVSELRKIYQTGGIAAVRHEIERQGAGKPPRLLALETIRVSQAFGMAIDEDASLALALEALTFDRSEPILRSIFWIAHRLRRFDIAYEIGAELKDHFGEDPTAVPTPALRKSRPAPANWKPLLKLIPPRRPPAIASERRRLLYVLHNSLPYSSGGYATRTHGFAKGLQAAGYEVVACTRPGYPIDMRPELTAADVPESETVDKVRYLRLLQPARNRMPFPKYVPAAVDALESCIRRLRPQFVMAASNYMTGLPALIAARRFGLPFVYEVSGLWEINRMSKEPGFDETASFELQKDLETAVARNADHVFTLTEGLREELLRRGIPKEKIVILPNSCDPAQFVPLPRNQELAKRLSIPANVPVIGYVGTFTAYEGLEDLATACGMLKAEGAKFRLLLVGNENTSGDSRGQISDQVARIADEGGYSNWLVMPGRVPHHEVARYYSLIDICPFPRKPWPVCEMVSPMKPLEALAMQKAVVVSSVRALAEMIRDGETGLIFQKGDTRALASALLRLMNGPAERIRLGTEGRAWVIRERTWHATARKAAAHLEEIAVAQ